MADMADNTSSIELSLGNVSLGVSGPQEFVEDQFDELYEKHGFDTIEVLNADIDVSEHDSGAEAQESPTVEQPDINKSLNELLQDSEVKTGKDRALVVGWYLIAGRNQDDITWFEVEEEAARSKVDLGENLTRDLSSNVEKGYLAPTGEERDGEDTYEVTGSGKEHLQKKGLPA